MKKVFLEQLDHEGSCVTLRLHRTRVLLCTCDLGLFAEMAPEMAPHGGCEFVGFEEARAILQVSPSPPPGEMVFHSLLRSCVPCRPLKPGCCESQSKCSVNGGLPVRPW